jgi:2-hydroxychromene-2-carboxylate isomerase
MTTRIQWVFDVISPFAYLALKQLPGLPETVGIEYVPILFAGLLNHFGQIGPAEIEHKRRFTYRFALWRARRMGIQMRLPPSHPFNPLLAQRLILAAGAERHVIEMVFDAAFLHGRDLSDPAVITDLGTRLKLADPQAAVQEPHIKGQLKKNTAWAISQGVFGVPTLIIGTELFWGHDAFDMAVDYLRHPQEFQDAEMRKVDQLPIGVVRPRKQS